jgi:hypothetical protein
VGQAAGWAAGIIVKTRRAGASRAISLCITKLEPGAALSFILFRKNVHAAGGSSQAAPEPLPSFCRQQAGTGRAFGPMSFDDQQQILNDQFSIEESEILKHCFTSTTHRKK